MVDIRRLLIQLELIAVQQTDGAFDRGSGAAGAFIIPGDGAGAVPGLPFRGQNERKHRPFLDGAAADRLRFFPRHRREDRSARVRFP